MYKICSSLERLPLGYFGVGCASIATNSLICGISVKVTLIMVNYGSNMAGTAYAVLINFVVAFGQRSYI